MTIVANLRRLPGIQVDVAPPPAAEALPRMDVAVFVGFASTGPLHLPVAIESPSQYATVFGADARLAWDARRGERVVAHLGPSVRAFFANGGRRCWVIRVAHSEWTERLRNRAAGEPSPAVAIANRFAVPGVLALPSTADALESAMLVARCEGAWSDPLTLSSALQRRGLAIEGWSAIASPSAGRYAFECRQPLRAGDLLQVGSDEDVCAYLRIERIEAGSAPATPYRAEAQLLAAFQRTMPSMSPDGIGGSARVGDDGSDTLATLRLDPAASAAGAARLEFDEALPATASRGHWARFDTGLDTIWMRIDGIERGASAATSPPSSQTDDIVTAVSGPAWRMLDETAIAMLEPVISAQALDIELRVASGESPVARLRGLGLTPERPVNVWEQQIDSVFYRQRDDVSMIAPEDLQRFPLAPEDTTPPHAWLPLGVGSLFGAAMPPSHQQATPLERDGLATFDSTLFLDPELEADSIDGLLAHADDIRLIRENTRALIGLHGVLGVGTGGLFSEISLLAIPDAIHLGWRRREDDPDPNATPPQPPPPAHWLGHRGACAQSAGNAAAGSGLEEPDFGAFLDCTTRRLDAPVLEGPDAPVRPGPYRLTWTQVEPGAQYVLFEAALADFSDEREIYRGADVEYVAMSQREGLYRYRVFADLGGERSAGSNPIAVRVRAEEWVQYEPGNGGAFEAEWLAIHRAALRMAAASGDLFVALSMPRHFETAEALRYAQRLRAVRQPPGIADAQAFGFNEARALSYGAMYFPWLQSDARGSQKTTGPEQRNRTAPGRVIPPDGVAVGVLAARASLRGAWIAAANEPMKDVVALTPSIPAGDRQILQDAQINLLRNDPRGFFALSADTLALDAELRQINVRRLLILLRRLALRRGTMYVFEPNGPVLRRSIQRGFDLLMTELFNRGAFAGATPAQAFRVVTDEGVNPRGSVEAGRLFVELRVAPSLPMRFIAVRLAQNGERLSVVEEL